MPYQAIRPDQAGYNIWTPQYAAATAARTGNPGADALKELALAIRASREGGSYANAIAAANANQLAGVQAELQGDIAGKYIQHAADLTKAGRPDVMPVGSNPYLTLDPNIAAQAGAVHLNKTSTEAIENQANTVATLAEVGMAPSMESVGQMITPVLQPEQMEVGKYITPADQADMIKANAAMLGAEASMVSANRPRGGGGDGDGGGAPVKVVIEPNLLDPRIPPKVRIESKDPEAARREAEKYQPSGGATSEATGRRESARDKRLRDRGWTQEGNRWIPPSRRGE